VAAVVAAANVMQMLSFTHELGNLDFMLFDSGGYVCVIGNEVYASVNCVLGQIKAKLGQS
jgi:hypothetical protein